MKRIAWLWVVASPVLAQAGETPSGADVPWAPLQQALIEATGNLGSLALLPLEATGTDEDLSGLGAKVHEALSARAGLRLVPADKVREAVGIEYRLEPAALGEIAAKIEVEAVLHVMVIRTVEAYDCALTLVDAKGALRFDRVVRIGALPPGLAPEPPPPPETPAPAAGPEGEPGPAPGPALDPREEYARRALRLAGRLEVRQGGGTIAVMGRHTALSIDVAPALVRRDWVVVTGEDSPVGELWLAEHAGRHDLVQRMRARIGEMKTLRNVGIGLTLGGFVTAGVAMPLWKTGSDDGLTAAGVVSSVGVVAGVVGLVLWLSYGPRAELAGGPESMEHLISRDEAEALIREANRALARELGLEAAEPRPSDAGAWHWQFAPGARGGGQIVLGTTF